MTEHFDAIVIGAGAMGSAAAYYLSERGQRVLLLEQFELDHRKGSSYGFSRIIRYSYDHPEYVALAKDTYPLWLALQEKLGEPLYYQTGGIDFGPATNETFQATIKAVQTSDISHELLSATEAGKRFPQFRFNEDFQVLYQPDTGFLTASKAVRGHIRLARENGAQVRENSPVEQIRISTDAVMLTVGNETYSAGKLVVTAGSWARTLLQQAGLDLPLVPLRCQLNFMAPADSENYQADSCPVWIAHVEELYGTSVYGIPSHHGSGFKIAFHGGPAIAHPAEINYEPDEKNVAKLRPFMSAHIPGIAAAPVQESRICLYTQDPRTNISSLIPIHCINMSSLALASAATASSSAQSLARC